MLTGLVTKFQVGGFTAFAGPAVMAAVKATLPVNPPDGVTVIVLAPPLPAVTVRLVGDAESAKLGTGAAFTMSAMVVEAEIMGISGGLALRGKVSR